jgi:ABC-2 type transport system ATP-binding protein
MQQVNAVEYNGVVKSYDRGVRALDGLTLAIPEGSIFGFIGLNGAGKTTAIKMIAGFLSPDSGSVRVFGKEISMRENSYKRDIGFVMDEPLYFDWMSGREYLQFAGSMYGVSLAESAKRSGELLDYFDLAEKADEPIKTYSTGMKKKVSLAAAILHRPRLIVLDEPLEGIDALAASTIKESLSLLAERGATILITSHVLDTVEKLCGEVAIIHRGAILLQCKTADIRTSAHRTLADATYSSLEELFVDLVSDKMKKKHLSWL